MREINATIIGLGPRGLSVLQRIADLAGKHRETAMINIHIVDPGEYGQGVHPARQPHHLVTNTLASQVTMFPLIDSVDPSKGNSGPSLTEWARQVNYRRFGDRYYRVYDDTGVEISDHDYLPRGMLGEYLTWVYDQIVQSLPENVRLICHRRRAVDVSLHKDAHYAVELQNGFTIISDFVFLSCGHGENTPTERDTAFQGFVERNGKDNTLLAYFSKVYPVERLLTISPDATVAVQGLGLTAHDVISELTVGRGGRFRQVGDRLAYEKSGREPRLLLFSRNCLPYAARGINQKGISGRHELRFFTKSAIQELRAEALKKRGSPQLDFKRELLPVLVREMGYAYRCADQGMQIAPESYSINSRERAAIEEVLNPLRGKSFASLADFKAYILDFMTADLAEAHRGNVASPVKAATDVIRDARESICFAVEYAGLTPESQRKFVREFVPLMNRISFGPPRRRNIELLALIRAGVLDWASGPAPELRVDEEEKRFVIESQFENGTERTFADVLLIARLDIFSPKTDSSELMRNLIHKGLIRAHLNGSFHPGGIDIDERNHPISADGRSLTNLWATGYPVEGAHFYTYALPRPQRHSRQIIDADRCVGEMFEVITAGESPAPLISRSRVA